MIQELLALLFWLLIMASLINSEANWDSSMGTKYVNDQIAEESVIGSLSIYTVRDVKTWRGNVDASNRYTGIDFTGQDWKALFYDVLACPRPEPYMEGEEVNDYDERYRVKFQKSLPEYPMLGRIWDMYVDAKYTKAEVEQLHNECLAIQASTTNTNALEGLEKLIRACDEAIRAKQGLFLASD
jgi:hypothetical protein